MSALHESIMKSSTCRLWTVHELTMNNKWQIGSWTLSLNYWWVTVQELQVTITFIHEHFMIQSWTFYSGLFLNCSWTTVPFVVHGQFMNNSWSVHEQFMNNSWTILGIGTCSISSWTCPGIIIFSESYSCRVKTFFQCQILSKFLS